MDNNDIGIVRVIVGKWSAEYEALSIRATKQTSSAEIVECIVERLNLDDNGTNGYELAEVIGNSVGQEYKGGRRLAPTECPLALQELWTTKNASQQENYKFRLKKKKII